MMSNIAKLVCLQLYELGASEQILDVILDNLDVVVAYARLDNVATLIYIIGML